MTRPALYVLGALLALGASFAAGRYSKPTTVETHTEYVDRFQVVRVVQVVRTVDTVTRWKKVTVSTPDGSTRTEETADTTSHEATTTSENEKTEKVTETATASKTVTRQPDWQISALLGVDAAKALNGSGSVSLNVGAHVQRRILGPLSVGVFGLSSGTVGVSAGLQF